MKSKLIALFFLFSASQVLQAQPPNQVPVGDTVYLYNPVKEKFFVGENLYKTQASLSARDQGELREGHQVSRGEG